MVNVSGRFFHRVVKTWKFQTNYTSGVLIQDWEHDSSLILSQYWNVLHRTCNLQLWTIVACSSVSCHTLFARTSLMTKEQRCSYLWNPPYDGHGWHCITIPVPPESQVSYCMHQHFSALLFCATVLFCRFGMVWGIHRGCEKSLKYWVIEFAACALLNLHSNQVYKNASWVLRSISKEVCPSQ